MCLAFVDTTLRRASFVSYDYVAHTESIRIHGEYNVNRWKQIKRAVKLVWWEQLLTGCNFLVGEPICNILRYVYIYIREDFARCTNSPSGRCGVSDDCDGFTNSPTTRRGSLTIRSADTALRHQKAPLLRWISTRSWNNSIYQRMLRFLPLVLFNFFQNNACFCNLPPNAVRSILKRSSNGCWMLGWPKIYVTFE